MPPLKELPARWCEAVRVQTLPVCTTPCLLTGSWNSASAVSALGLLGQSDPSKYVASTRSTDSCFGGLNSRVRWFFGVKPSKRTQVSREQGLSRHHTRCRHDLSPHIDGGVDAVASP